MTPFLRARHRGGFTLVELLTAITISVIIVLMFVMLTSGALRNSTNTNNSLLALSAGNAALDLVANDLQSVVATGQPSPTGATTTQGPYEFLQAVPDPNLTTLPGGTPLLLMLNAASAQDSTSDTTDSTDLGIQPRAICYQVALQDPMNASNTKTSAMIYGLYRTVKTASVTFTSFLGLSDLYTGGWKTILQSSPPATSAFVANNVVDFQVTFYACRINATTGKLGTIPYPLYSSSLAGTASLHLTSTGSTISAVAANLDSTYTHGPVTYADVTLVVLENTGAVQLTAQPVTATRLAAAKTLYGHSLIRRVPLSQPF